MTKKKQNRKSQSMAKIAHGLNSMLDANAVHQADTFVLNATIPFDLNLFKLGKKKTIKVLRSMLNEVVSQKVNELPDILFGGRV